MLRTTFALLANLSSLLARVFRSRAEVAAENLFLRKQLACYLERRVRQWEFEPSMVEKVAVPVCLTVTVNINLQ